ncbi:uncharacterized protein LOC141613125 [Silene latifolia]|uniref:uncharacterized protein LOC141613125 n=1 Tax=Silene latifolia TaxID=37657 RepID=UPI003D76AFBF
MHLKSYALGDAIKVGNTASEQNKAQAMILLRRHLHEGLKYEYLTVKDPLILWQNLKERYDHLKTQYRQRGFKKYSELVSCLLVAEQNSEILLKNYQSRPTGTDPLPAVNATVSGPFPEVNATRYDNNHKYSSPTRSGGRGRGRGNYQGGRGGKFKKSYSHQKDGPYEKNEKGLENLCHRCGSIGHWGRTCRTPKHLVDLYQQSQKNNKGKNIEANFTDKHDNFETNYADGDNYLSPKSGEYLDLDDSDFLNYDTSGEIGPVIGDESVQRLD